MYTLAKCWTQIFQNIVDHLGKVDAQHLEDGKDNVQAVGDVEGGEDVVEAVAPHVLGVEDDNADQVPNKSKKSSH